MRTDIIRVKIFALCLVIVMAFAFMPGAGAGVVSAADRSADISSSADLAVEAGGTITVPINISDYSGIMGMVLVLTYDAEVLTPVSVEGTDLTANGIINDSIETSNDNTFKIVWSDSENITQSGTLFNVTFNVSEYAEGETDIGIAPIDKSAKNIYDEDGNYVELNCTPASVRILEKVYSSPTLHCSPNQSAEDGSEISVPVVLENPSGIQSLSFRISYNAGIFAYDSVEGGIAPLSGISASATAGAVDITVSDIPESAGSGTLLTLKFKTAEYKGGSFVFDMSSDDVDTEDFRVKVTNTHASESSIVSGSEPLLSGDQLYVPVMITNNHGVAGFRIRIAYDKDILEPVSVAKDTKLAGSFNNSIENAQGTFDLLWTGTDNMTEDGILFTLLFTVKKAQDTVISLDYVQGDTCDEDLQSVFFTMQDISVPLNGAIIKKDPVDLSKCRAKISGIGNMTYTTSLKKAQTYFGKKVVVKAGSKKLKLGKDYRVSTSKSVNVGKAKITVYGMGDYTGKLVKTIKINPAGAKISKLKAASKGFTVKWKKQSKKMGSSRITGYQIRYSFKSSMKKSKTVTVKGYKKTSKKIRKLKAKKKYYVQIRTYKKVKGKKYYSKWSKKKAIKTKK